jgi:phage host-nuclease inhibitor protein Gam
MPSFTDITVVIVLVRENTRSKLSFKEKVTIEGPISGCSVKEGVEKFVIANFENWILLEYQTI